MSGLPLPLQVDEGYTLARHRSGYFDFAIAYVKPLLRKTMPVCWMLVSKLWTNTLISSYVYLYGGCVIVSYIQYSLDCNQGKIRT